MRIKHITMIMLSLAVIAASADPGVRRPPELWRLDLDGDGDEEEVYVDAYTEDRHGYDETFIELTLEGELIAEINLGPRGHLSSMVPEPLPDGGEGLLALHGMSLGLSAGREDWTSLWAWSSDEGRLTLSLSLLTGYHSDGCGLDSVVRRGTENSAADYIIDAIVLYEAPDGASEGVTTTPGGFEFRFPGVVELELSDVDHRYHPAFYRQDNAALPWPSAEREGGEWLYDLEMLRPWPGTSFISIWPDTGNAAPTGILEYASAAEGTLIELWRDPSTLGLTKLGGYDYPAVGMAYDDMSLYLWGPLGEALPVSLLGLSLGTTAESAELTLSWNGEPDVEAPAGARFIELGPGRFIVQLPWSALKLDGPTPLYLTIGSDTETEGPIELLVPVHRLD